jgi:ketosteroid isomerase-like protein
MMKRTFVAVLVLIGLVALAACGGSSTSTSNSTSPVATAPSASPSIVRAEEPVSQWDSPGSATLAQTKAVAKEWAAALTAEKIPGAGLYAEDATFDYWASGEIHDKGAPAIEATYQDAADALDWGEGHVCIGPGVIVYEEMLTVNDSTAARFPTLSLLAVDGTQVSHEEVFLDPGPDTKRAVIFARSAPSTQDTAEVATEVATAAGDAFATGDQVALRGLLAPDVRFYDSALRHGVSGVDAVLDWRSRTPTVDFSNQEPIAGPGWAVVRWTARRVYSTGVEVAMPGATMMEVRDGKVARMTLYYDNAVVGLQE